MPEHTEISRVVLRNYKSIRHCDVRLGPITFLVGPNGAGKSNFVEALRFISYGLSSSLERAIENRSGFSSIVHRGSDAPPGISLQFFFNLGGEKSGNYAVSIEARQDGPVWVSKEECSVDSPESRDWFTVNRGVVTSNHALMPAASDEKLYLVNASGLEPFESVYRVLSSMVLYNPVPDEIRGFKPEKNYRNLDRTASALAETVFKLKTRAPERLERVTEYLRRIYPDIVAVDAVSIDANYSLRFELDRGGGARETFPTQNISDGTLRALAVLVALFQKSDRYPPSLIALEEPEAGLHPSAAGVLFDSLVEASQFSQIVVTSHSPDLLDREDIPENSLKAVVMREGRTIIGEADEVGRTALRDRLYTAGELMRMDQLRPEGAFDRADAG